MKARDIIPGWPRGHSTSAPFPTETPMWRLGTDWGEVADRLIDSEDNRKYHAEQERMMHEWRTKTGRFRPPHNYEFCLVGFKP
jgi:hypothetical protein